MADEFSAEKFRDRGSLPRDFAAFFAGADNTIETREYI